MANTALLGKPGSQKRSGTNRDKGAPPARVEAPRNMEKAPRETSTRKKSLQFPLSDDMLEAFNNEAHAKFGMNKGAKLSLFLEMWQVYQASKKA